MYKFFSSFRTSDFSSTGRLCRRLPKVGWVAVRAGRLAGDLVEFLGLLAEGLVGFLGEVGAGSNVSIVLPIMITEGMAFGVDFQVFIRIAGWMRGLLGWSSSNQNSALHAGC